MADPRRVEEAAEWFEAAVMLIVKDGLDVELTGHTTQRGRAAEPARRVVAGPVRVVGDLDGTAWSGEHTFDVPGGCEVHGFQAWTPEGELVARDRLPAEAFPYAPGGTYALSVAIDWTLIPMVGDG